MRYYEILGLLQDNPDFSYSCEEIASRLECTKLNIQVQLRKLLFNNKIKLIVKHPHKFYKIK